MGMRGILESNVMEEMTSELRERLPHRGRLQRMGQIERGEKGAAPLVNAHMKAGPQDQRRTTRSSIF